MPDGGSIPKNLKNQFYELPYVSFTSPNLGMKQKRTPSDDLRDLNSYYEKVHNLSRDRLKTYDTRDNSIKLSEGIMRGAKANPKMLSDLVKAADDNKLDRNTMLAIAAQESMFGKGYKQKTNVEDPKRIYQGNVMSSCSVAADHSVPDMLSFLYKKGVPGLVSGSNFDESYINMPDPKSFWNSADSALNKHPEWVNQYENEVSKVVPIGDVDVFDEMAKKIKKVGIAKLNPGLSTYENSIHRLENNVQNDKAIQSFYNQYDKLNKNKMPGGGTINPQDQSVKDWYSSYINSPKYKERLSNFYQYPSYIQNKRSNELDSTTFDSRTTSPTRYYSNDNSININPGQLNAYGASRQEGVAHELGHLSNAGLDPSLQLSSPESEFILNRNKTTTPEYRKGVFTRASESNQNVSDFLQASSKGLSHDIAPSESKSDIDAFRYLLNQRKIYNAGTQDINQQTLDKASKDSQIKNSFIYKRLKDNFDDKGLLEIMNKVAVNTPNSSNMAQYGTQLPSYNPIYGYGDMSNRDTYNPTEYMDEAKSGIHINPANKGKFNATKKKTGKSTEELTHSSNPITKKRAIFAQNARKWNHAEFGDQIEQADDNISKFFKARRNQIPNDASLNGNGDKRLVNPEDNSLYEDNRDSGSLSSTGEGISTGANIHFNLGSLATGLGALVGQAYNKNEEINDYANQVRRNAQIPVYTPHQYGTGSQALYANGGIVTGSTHYMSDKQIKDLQSQGYDFEFLD